MHPAMGKEVEDTVTGFKGTITARYEFINGCVQYLVEGRVKDNETKDTAVDEQRLKVQVPEMGETMPLNDWLIERPETKDAEPAIAQTGGGARRAPRRSS